jgi:sec-independent protein translocase protein TatA
MPNIGPAELIIVLVIALLVLGPKRLPEAGRSLGSGIRGFKESVSGRDDKTESPEEISRNVQGA